MLTEEQIEKLEEIGFKKNPTEAFGVSQFQHGDIFVYTSPYKEYDFATMLLGTGLSKEYHKSLIHLWNQVCDIMGKPDDKLIEEE